MLIPAFIQRELAPLTHTHSQGDIVGAGAKASAAVFGIFISTKAEAANSIKAYFEVRDGLSSRASQQWLIEAFTDASISPAAQPRGTAISAATVDTGTFYASVLAANQRAKDFFFHTTDKGSAVVAYAQSNAAASVHLGAVLVGPTTPGSKLVFTA